MRELEVLTIGMGGHKMFPPFKTGGANRFTLSRGGGGTKGFRPVIPPFCTPLPVINDQSLRAAANGL